MRLNKRQRVLLLYPLTLVTVALLYKYFNPLESLFFPKCPVKAITGLDCPGCGGQRAAHSLLNGDVRQAFMENPLLPLLIPYLILGFYLQIIPQPTNGELKLKKVLYGQSAILILGIILFIFTILRNIIS
ncbi:DUF2752 domain-containing protein [Sphingobacterium paucimobilis]|uniref:DUF2752 domain-containing protein n=1 Tax=Sphingobacterium paucimobilis HER1398 TaxID=1346330 RepID=U2J6Z4_9SPHI|nr:hypothetical protein M472_06580 [Sphingobacterium paucimobilis HER1398]